MLGSLITRKIWIGEYPSIKKKTIAFKASIEREEELVEEKLALLTRNSSSFSTKLQTQEMEKLETKRHPTYVVKGRKPGHFETKPLLNND